MRHRLRWRWMSAISTLLVLLAGCGTATSLREPPPSSPISAATQSPVGGTPEVRATPQPADATPAGGETLRLLWWQAPTILNPHLVSGGKDTDASRPVYEPLASFDRDGRLVPFLAAEIPSRENGGVAADGRSVTWKLKPGVRWADGTPFTSDDVSFTYAYVTNKATAAATVSTYSAVSSVEAVDPTTVKIRFNDVNPAWALPFVGISGLILPRHIFQDYTGTKAREAPANLKPVGTGPYRVLEFKPGDVVVYEANPLFRETGKPFFSRVVLKGGGDAASAARAVLQTGDADFAWNLQVEAQVLSQLQTGRAGRIILNPGPNSERLELNRTDPNVEVDGERSSRKAPHPFFTDPQVRKAFGLAIDRASIAQQLYGLAGEPATNVLLSPTNVASPNTSFEFNLQKANALLDAGGWRDSDGDGVRDKGGVKLQILFQTSVNPLRQKTQELIKQALESIGVRVTLKSVESSVFFDDSNPANVDSFNHFYADVQM